MKNDSVFNQLREASWRRKLTPAEEAQLADWLAAHPEAQADWEAERMLNAGLNRLPVAPVPSNFTARVLQAVQSETAAAGRKTPRGWRLWHWRLRWLHSTALAAVVLCAGLLAHHHHAQVVRNLEEIGQSLSAVSEVPPLASPEVLENFEAIQAMAQVPPADDELIKLLQ